MAREAINAQQPLAERVLLAGDPGRALRLAQVLIDGPKMLNHRRGLWGYSGPAVADGAPLSIQSTGIGGPSAAIVVEELIGLGARVLIRTGTCGSLDGGHALGDLVTATEVIGADGASRALGAGDRLRADPELSEALVARGGRTAIAVSTDLFYDPRPLDAAGAAVVEMEAAALLSVAARHGLPAACVLAVSDVVADGARISGDGLVEAERRLGDAGFAAMAASVERLVAPPHVNGGH
jgi:uridine phosphorylase